MLGQWLKICEIIEMFNIYNRLKKEISFIIREIKESLNVPVPEDYRKWYTETLINDFRDLMLGHLAWILMGYTLSIVG
jgi:hypothetical protein